MDQVQFEEDTFVIQTEVVDPVIKDGLQKYVVYVFKGVDKHGSFEIQRRYSEFDTFRGIMSQRWPGCYVPPLPVKKVGSMDQKFIEERRHYLDLFSKKLSQLKHLWYSQEAEMFKRSSGDIDKLLAGLPRQTTNDVIEKYSKSFSGLSGREINNEIITLIGSFQLYLKKIQPLLNKYSDSAKQLVQSKSTLNDNMTLFLDYLMPDYEKNCLTEYVVNPESKMVFFGQSHDQLNQLKVVNQLNSYEALYLLIKIEDKEIDALQEAFSQKDRLEQQKLAAQGKLRDLQAEKRDVEAGKTTIKTLFNKNKEENLFKIQTNIDLTQKEIEQLQTLGDMVTLIIGYVEIPAFKVDKEQQYLKLLKQLSEYEVQKAKINQEYWQSLLQNNIFLEI